MHRKLVIVCAVAALLAPLAATAQNPGPSAPPPRPEDVRLVGDRFPPLTYRAMTPAQKTMFEHLINGDRRGATGPFNVLLRSPEMGDLVQEFGSQMRYHSSVPNRLNEFAIIITARYWTSQYEWWAHRLAAQKAGLPQSIIDAVAAGTRPASMQPDEAAVYDFATEILHTKHVSDATFAAASRAFGERGVVDLMGVISYYQLVSMVLNVDRHPMPAGVEAELTPLP